MSDGMPQMPNGGESSAPPTMPLPWVSVSMKALRSNVNAIARRTSGLLNGAASRLMMLLRSTLVGDMRQSSCPTCLFISFSIGTCRKYHEVMSTLLDTKASAPVATFLMSWYSMASRYGRSFFQYSGLRVTLMYSFGLNSTNLNGPVPIGRCRISAADTWQG